MKNKAFTLIEILAVIIILGIVLLVIIPNVFVTVDKSKADVYKIKENNMAKGAKEYAMYNELVLPLNIGERINVGLTSLVDNNFIAKIYDLQDQSLCIGYVYIEKTNTSNYSYNPCLFCTTYQTNNAICNISNAG